MERRSQHEQGLTLDELARRHDCVVRGAPDTRVYRVAPLGRADSRCIAFFLQRARLDDLRATTAGAVILSEQYAGECPVASLLTADPYGVFARVADDLHGLLPLDPGIHRDATVSRDATVDPSSEIAPGARVASGAVLQRGVFVGSNATVGAGARIGAGTRLLANAVICEGVAIGRRCIVHPGAVVGSDGFGQAPESGGGWRKIPQLGSVRVGDDVEIGANTVIDRGTMDDTVVGNGVRLDNLIQVGHNAQIGEHTAIAGCVAIAGSTRVGRRCRIAGQVGIGGHLEICDDVVLLARTVVSRSITRPGAYAGSLTPMEEVSSWRRNAARFRRLDDLFRRVGRLEQAE